MADPNNPQTELLDRRVADVPGHLLSGPNSGLVSARADATRSPMALGDSGSFRHSGKAPAFHGTLESTASARMIKKTFGSKLESLRGLDTMDFKGRISGA